MGLRDKIQKTILSTVILVLTFAAVSFSGWGENIRLTYRGQEINPQVIARNDTVHVVWFQINGNVSYIRSTDGGDTWDDIVDLTETNHTGSYSNLNLDENGLLVSWLDDDDNQDITKIGIATSPDGAVWNQNLYVATDNPNRFTFPASAIKGDSVFLVYYSYRDDSTGRSPVRSIHSYNYGQTWSDETSIYHPLISIGLPMSMEYCGGILMVAWTCMPDSNHLGEWHILGKRSTDAGITWSDTIWISPNRQDWALEQILACNQHGNGIAAGYLDYRFLQYPFHGDAFVAISNDDGSTWPFETMSSYYHTAWWPSVDFVEDTLLAVWSDMRFYDEGLHEIIINRSDDLGMSWHGEYRVTISPDESLVPWLSYDDGNINIVWREEVYGSQNEIFFKRYTPDVAEIYENGESAPSQISIAAYPNPFNSNLQIVVYSDHPGLITIYDVQGRFINELSFPDGSSNTIWEGRDKEGRPVSTGTYFLEAKGGNMKKKIKVVYLK